MHADRWLALRTTAPRPGNYFLRALSEEAFTRLRPHLEIFVVPNGFSPVQRPDDTQYVYFPVSCVLNVRGELADGASAEIAIVGRFGFLGATGLLGVRGPTGGVTAIHGGQLARVRCAAAAPILLGSQGMEDEMLRYLVFMMHIASVSVVCQRHHSLEQRLARWLSSMRFQTGIDTLDITHDQLGRLLGVRREGVSETMKQFEGAELIASTRGHLHILDLPRLRRRSCGCHQEALDIHQRFFPNRPFEAVPVVSTVSPRPERATHYAEVV